MMRCGNIYAKAQARAMKAPPTVQKLVATWPAALKAVEEAAGAPDPEITAPVVGAATRGVEVIKWEAEEEAATEEDTLGEEIALELGVALEVEVSKTVLLGVAVEVGVAVDVGVGVLVEQGPVTVTGIQFRLSELRVPEGVTVPAEAWQEA